LRELRPDLPPGLEAIIARCLRRLPTERYANVGALTKDLAPFAEAGPVPAPPPTAPGPPPAARPVFRRWIAVAGSLLLIVALAVAIGRHRRAAPVSIAPPQPLPHAAETATIAPPAVAPQSCRACLAANCAKEYALCLSNRACRLALAGADACVQPAGDAPLADCARLLRTSRGPAARKLTTCMFARRGDAAAAGSDKCASVCGAGTISGDVPLTGDERRR
jgi:hypothetical protein